MRASDDDCRDGHTLVDHPQSPARTAWTTHSATHGSRAAIVRRPAARRRQQTVFAADRYDDRGTGSPSNDCQS